MLFKLVDIGSIVRVGINTDDITLTDAGKADGAPNKANMLPSGIAKGINYFPAHIKTAGDVVDRVDEESMIAGAQNWTARASFDFSWCVHFFTS